MRAAPLRHRGDDVAPDGQVAGGRLDAEAQLRVRSGLGVDGLFVMVHGDGFLATAPGSDRGAGVGTVVFAYLLVGRPSQNPLHRLRGDSPGYTHRFGAQPAAGRW